LAYLPVEFGTEPVEAVLKAVFLGQLQLPAEPGHLGPGVGCLLPGIIVATGADAAALPSILESHGQPPALFVGIQFSSGERTTPAG
jgi:hypothetical protein